MYDKMLRPILVLVGAFVLCGVIALPPRAAVAADACKDVPQPFVVPIPTAHAAAANSLLNTRSVVELTDTQASKLLDVAPGRRSLAETMLKHAITQRPAPRPYLVRAVRGFEGTGGYSASQCGDRLSVFHGSLGMKIPEPTPATLIVFLTQKPIRIDATYSVAQ